MPTLSAHLLITAGEILIKNTRQKAEYFYLITLIKITDTKSEANRQGNWKGFPGC